MRLTEDQLAPMWLPYCPKAHLLIGNISNIYRYVPNCNARIASIIRRCAISSPLPRHHAIVRRALPGVSVYALAMIEPAPASHPISPLRFAPLLLICLACGGLLACRIDTWVSLDQLLRSRDSLMHAVAEHYAAALGLFALAYATAVAVSLPGATLLTLAAGFMFGGWLGGGVAATAATTGAVLLFLAARSSLGAVLAARAGPQLERFRAGFAADAASYMLFLRLAPVFPFWLVNLAAALTGVGLGTFVWTTFLGILPATFVFAFAGAGLDSVARAQEDARAACASQAHAVCGSGFSLGSLLTHDTMLAFAGLALLSLVPALLKRWRKTTGPPARQPKPEA